MDEKEKIEDLNFEDIMKEFGGNDPDDDVVVWDGRSPLKKKDKISDTVPLGEVSEAIREHEKASVTDDTAVFASLDDTVAFKPVGDTVAFKPVEDTVAFSPVGVQEEEEDFVMPQPAAPKVEPYSQQWEPEYEQPIGEYAPSEPIVFRPKSRLHELKRKLVAGPEKRFYDLAEKGLGKLQAAIFVNLVVALTAMGSTMLYAMGSIGQERTRLVVFIQFLSLLISALLGSYQLMAGFVDILRKRFSLNSLLIFSFAACLTDGILCLSQVRIPFCAAFSLHMTMSLWSAYHKRSTEMAQMDTMRKAVILDGIAGVEDFYNGRPGFVRSEGQVEHFMDTYSAASGPEKVLSVYALVALIASLGIGIFAGAMDGAVKGVQAFSAALLVAVPASVHVALTRPETLLQRRLHRLGAVICGWQGVKGLSRSGVFPVGDRDMFPSGSSKMNGVKFYGSRKPDEVVAYAAAVISTGGSAMEPLFTQLLDSRGGHHYPAVNVQFYPGGIGGEVKGESVLAGSLNFVKEMGVEVPEGTRVNHAVYVAIDGELSGVFAISYIKSKAVLAGLTTLGAYRGLTPVLSCSDFMITEKFMRTRFGINTRRMEFPDRTQRQELQQVRPDENAPVFALTTREGLAPSAFAVTGARALNTASKAGVAVHMIGGILGLVIMVLLNIVGATELLTPANVLLYELIWTIPGILITEWTRNI